MAEGNGTRLSSDWKPSLELIQWAKDTLVATLDDLDHETEQFRNYWLGAPGQKGRKLDWPATWRNWMLKAFRRKVPDRPAEAKPDRPRMILRTWKEAQHEYVERFTRRVGHGYVVDRKAAFQAYCKDIENGENAISI